MGRWPWKLMCPTCHTVRPGALSRGWRHGGPPRPKITACTPSPAGDGAGATCCLVLPAGLALSRPCSPLGVAWARMGPPYDPLWIWGGSWMQKGGAPEAAASRSSATHSNNTSRLPSSSRHLSSSRATVSAALEFACSHRVCGVVAAAWLEALAADRTCRGVRAGGVWPRRPRPAARYRARAA